MLAACAGSTTVTVVDAPATSTAGGPVTSVPDGTVAAATIDWRPCGTRTECGTLVVPLDHARTAAGDETITLALRRHPATSPARRIGSLVLNPGGPGVPALDYADAAPSLFPGLVEQFDIVAWDPRGVGESSPVDCGDDLDTRLALDPTPDTPAEREALIAAAERFVDGCRSRSGRLLPYVGTADTARDLDRIRAALGEDRLTFFGFSYGSEIGATYATLFPQRVRAMVLDGAADANATFEQDGIEQARNLEQALERLLADCAAQRSCPFWNQGRPAAAFDDLLATLDRTPLPSPAGRPAVGQGVAYIAVVSALYDASLWRPLTRALAAAQRGDGSGLLELFDRYTNRGDPAWANTFDALSAVNCVDDPGPTDPAFPEQFAERLAAVAPRLGRSLGYGYVCPRWPAQAPRVELTAAGVAGPILVVGTTGDPITPLTSSANLAADLERATLLTVEAEGHTGYSRTACSRRTVDAFVLDLVVPAAGTVCRR